MNASKMRSSQAMPQGLVCLMTTAQARSSNSLSRESADSMSRMLLNDSSLPCSCFILATATPVTKGSP